MGFLKDIFLSKEDKRVVDVYNELNNYWRNYNDFIDSHKYYLFGINNQFNLGLSDQVFDKVPFLILSQLLERGLSQSNIMFIFSQYVVFYILKEKDPKNDRINDQVLLAIAENIKSFIIPYSSNVTPEFSHQIDKNKDVLSVVDVRSFHSESNREISAKKLASNLVCSLEDLRKTVFEQLESMNATREILDDQIRKHQATKLDQAQEYNMLPDDTPASILIEIIEEYVEELKSKKKSDEFGESFLRRLEEKKEMIRKMHNDDSII
jgi:hypothetical protein